MASILRRIWPLAALLAVCFAAPAYAEEPEFNVPEIPGAAALQEQQTESVTVTYQYDPNGNLIAAAPEAPAAETPEAAQPEPVPVPTPAPEAPVDMSQFDIPDDYSGQLDAITGQPIDARALHSENGIYELEAGRMSFDSLRRMYMLFCGDNFVTCSLPAGAVVNSDVHLCINEAVGLSIELYRNGILVQDEDISDITGPGSYLLTLTNNSGEQTSFSFTLVDRYTNVLSEMLLPAGFHFSRISLNGNEQTPEYGNYMDFLVDGEYQIEWACDTIAASYSANFILDRQAPTLELADVKNGFAESSVSLADMEDGCYVLCSYEGLVRTITDKEEVLSAPGKYIIQIVDQAGNYTTYEFRIKMHLDFKGGTAILLLAIALTCILVYSHRLHKHPRVY